MPYYIVWLENLTDHRDDEPIKVKASSRKKAEEIGQNYTRGRFGVGRVYTYKEFRKIDPFWHTIFWGKKAENE
jgi:hypothetical protein